MLVAATPPPIAAAQPIEVSFVDEVGLDLRRARSRRRGAGARRRRRGRPDRGCRAGARRRSPRRCRRQARRRARERRAAATAGPPAGAGRARSPAPASAPAARSSTIAISSRASAPTASRSSNRPPAHDRAGAQRASIRGRSPAQLEPCAERQPFPAPQARRDQGRTSRRHARTATAALAGADVVGRRRRRERRTARYEPRMQRARARRRPSAARRSAACPPNFTTSAAAGVSSTTSFRRGQLMTIARIFDHSPRPCPGASPLARLAQDATPPPAQEDEPIERRRHGRLPRRIADRRPGHADAAARPTRRPATPRRSAGRSPRSSPPTCAISGLFRRSGPSGLRAVSYPAGDRARLSPIWRGHRRAEPRPGLRPGQSGNGTLTVGCYLYDVAAAVRARPPGLCRRSRATGAAPRTDAPTPSIRG